MPILELTDEQVIDLVRQLSPERQRARTAGAGRGAGEAQNGCSMQKPDCAGYAPSVGSTGTRWRKTSARR